MKTVFMFFFVKSKNQLPTLDKLTIEMENCTDDE